MSKRDCNRKGYLKGSVRSRIVCEKQLISIEKTAKDKKEIRKPQLGPRAIAWNEFRKTGKIDRAYEMIAEIYGENTFSNNDLKKILPSKGIIGIKLKSIIEKLYLFCLNLK